MNRKKNVPVSSTPCINKNHVLLSLFEDIGVSPITSTSQLKVPVDPRPIQPPAKPKDCPKTAATRKRRIKRKEIAAPESVTAGVLKELGVEAEDICHNNVLSCSRNLYSMFPEPIILDSDEESNEIARKPVKKAKQNSKVVQSGATKNQEKKKDKERVPGSSRTTRSSRLAADKKPKEELSAQASSSVQAVTKNPKAISKSNLQTKGKVPDAHSSPSFTVVDDDNDDDDHIFPLHKPKTLNRKTLREKVNHSLELDEKFPIQWSARQKKSAENNTRKVVDVEKELHKSENAQILTALEPNAGTKSDHVDNGEKGNSVLISRFEDVRFKFNNTSGGIIARCLKTDQADIGYLEVLANKPFNGQRANITFVVIEGKAEVLHRGVQHILSPGDMVHISDDSGYKFSSAGKDHVRFLYIKGH